MARAAVLFENLADAASVTTSSWIASSPPATLQNAHVSRRWKGRSGDTEYVLADLGSLQSIDSFGLFGCAAIVEDEQGAMTSAAVTRVRVSSVDDTGVAGDLYDSGSADGRIDAAYGALVTHLAAPVSGRYVRLDLSQSSADALLAGRLVIGLRQTFALNFAYGWSFGYGDLSRLKKSAAGQTFVDRDARYRILNANFEALNSNERYGFVQDMDRLNGINQDVMFIVDPESANPARDTVWGLMKDLSLPAQSNYAQYTKSYAIEERL